jgi:hypothetical protein
MSFMQMRMIIGFITLCAALLCLPMAAAGAPAQADQVYINASTYVAERFAGEPPAQETLWPSSDLRTQLKNILGHAPSLRFKYWGAGGKTVWILDEIGKDRPITAGVTITDNRIEDVQVLVFRESRGWEVKYEFFTSQFANLWLDRDQQLSGKVDNITGATLSVKAMKRMAKAALLMHRATPQAQTTLADAR